MNANYVEAFNSLFRPKLACPHCGFWQDWTIQFKYGAYRRYQYQLGDTLLWSGNDAGKNAGSSVRVEGKAENACLNCNDENVEAAIAVEDNKLQSVILLAYPLNLKEGFEVI
jgi:hypothetical protein